MACASGLEVLISRMIYCFSMRAMLESISLEWLAGHLAQSANPHAAHSGEGMSSLLVSSGVSACW